LPEAFFPLPGFVSLPVSLAGWTGIALPTATSIPVTTITATARRNHLAVSFRISRPLLFELWKQNLYKDSKGWL
jgi:hypothetical protein